MTLPARNVVTFGVFELRGERQTFTKGVGNSPEWEPQVFSLDEGLMLVKTEHEGRGLLKVELSRVEPGFFDEDDVLFEYEGPYASEMAWVVIDGDWRAPRPGERYQLKVTSNSNWTIEILQPDLGQSRTPIPYHVVSQQGGVYLVGPIQAPARPLLAKAKHNARGGFYAQILPVDGSHEEVNFIATTGQTILEDYPTQMLPGKEYIIEIGAGGGWELEIYEGY